MHPDYVMFRWFSLMNASLHHMQQVHLFFKPSTILFSNVAADKLLLNKNHRELLQPYEQRRDTAVRFMQAVRPGLQVEAGPLTDPTVSLWDCFRSWRLVLASLG